MNPKVHTLLWFRPLSPIHYALPEPIAGLPWANTQHIPIDILQSCSVSALDAASLKTTPTWLLSSPTAAYLAATLGAPSCIAAMGAPTQAAWRDAGGAEPEQWLLSPTGESMGLTSSLSQHPKLCVLRGKQGRNDLIESLYLSGVVIQTVAIYDKTQHPQWGDDLNFALSKGAVTLYLSSTDQPARVLAAALDKAKLLCSPVLTSHFRIEQAARQLGFTSVSAAPMQ